MDELLLNGSLENARLLYQVSALPQPPAYPHCEGGLGVLCHPPLAAKPLSPADTYFSVGVNPFGCSNNPFGCSNNPFGCSNNPFRCSNNPFGCSNNPFGCSNSTGGDSNRNPRCTLKPCIPLFLLTIIGSDYYLYMFPRNAIRLCVHVFEFLIISHFIIFPL